MLSNQGKTSVNKLIKEKHAQGVKVCVMGCGAEKSDHPCLSGLLT